MKKRLMLAGLFLLAFVASIIGQNFLIPTYDVTIYRKCGCIIADRDTFPFATVRLVSSAKYSAGVSVEILDPLDNVLKSYRFPKSYLYCFPTRKLITVGHDVVQTEVSIAIPEYESEQQRLKSEIYYGEYRWFGIIKERGIDF